MQNQPQNKQQQQQQQQQQQLHNYQGSQRPPQQFTQQSYTADPQQLSQTRPQQPNQFNQPTLRPNSSNAGPQPQFNRLDGQNIPGVPQQSFSRPLSVQTSNSNQQYQPQNRPESQQSHYSQQSNTGSQSTSTSQFNTQPIFQHTTGASQVKTPLVANPSQQPQPGVPQLSAKQGLQTSQFSQPGSFQYSQQPGNQYERPLVPNQFNHPARPIHTPAGVPHSTPAAGNIQFSQPQTSLSSNLGGPQHQPAGVPQYTQSPATSQFATTPSVTQFRPASTPQFNQPGVSQFNQPGGSQFNQPGVPQFNQPGVSQFNQPGVPQVNQPGVPQFNQPGVPQFNQQQTSQFNQPPVPQFNQPPVPQFNQPPVPQFGQPGVQNPGVSNLTNQFQNLGVTQQGFQAGGYQTQSGEPQLQKIFNMLSGPPPTWDMYSQPQRNWMPGEEPVPVINPESIVRCRRCRTYINPWIQFVDQGTRWKCNLCYLPNEGIIIRLLPKNGNILVPSFFCWDEQNNSTNPLLRPELTHGVVEFIAPQEYMVRPPQPVVLLFIIDVSCNAVKSGMLAIATRTILDTLDKIPNADNRTKVAFITVDSSIHFYNLNASQNEPQMLVVSDLEGEPYLPCPEDLLVSLTESRSIIENLLERLGGDMFKNTTNSGNCLGRALHFGFKMIVKKMLNSIGGKIIILQNTLPNVEDGSLKAREDPKLLGTPKEVQLLNPASQFYKSLAVDCSRSQVCIDIFLFNSQYADVATLSGCAKYTGGSVFYYPNFNAERTEDTLKFSNEFSHFLGKPIGLEAVLRVRASRGIQMSSYHGNFFLRSTDLLQLPNVNPDNSYTIEMTIDENLTGTVACFQTALLHTSSSGERRIRVLTLALPITSNIQDVFSSADARTITTLLTKKAVERALTSKIEDAREAVLFKLIEIISSYKSNCTSSGQSMQLLVPENLKLLPILTLGLLKSMAFRDTNIIPSDMRSYVMSTFYVTSVDTNTCQVHPRFWSVQNLHPNVGLPGEDGSIVFPPLLNLSSEKLERVGIYLLDTGFEIFLWVGKGVFPEQCNLLFGRNYEALPSGKFTLPVLENEFNSKVNTLIEKIRQLRTTTSSVFPHLYIVKEDGDGGLRQWFLSYLVEDRQSETLVSYPQFMQQLKVELAGVSAG
ncbi:COPII subunit [Clydaea vesicula]|uniref:COPII subunit n=1 Tax=Clydaea vesicula TaxID=447962 RepID=A0AAD5Y1Q2_9FUNG|nr:COPII subunit [Clydaea vesicula]